MPTRESITGKLAKERDALVARYRAFSAEELTRPCTESEADDGRPWSAKDHVAHLAMIERAFQAMIARHLDGHDSPVGLGGGSRDEVIGRVHRQNEVNVDAHRDDDIDTLLDDL